MRPLKLTISAFGPYAGECVLDLESAGAQGREVQLHPARIGAEGGQGQFQRSHFSPSQMDSISSLMKSRWISDMG